MKLQAIICDFSGVILQRNDASISTSYTQHYQSVSTQSDFAFSDHFTFNLDLINFLKINFQNIPLVLFSHSQLYGLTQSSQIVGNTFGYIFSPDGIDRKKTDPEAYELISHALGVEPNHTLFIDDQIDNIKASLQAGMQGAHFHDTSKMIQYLDMLANNLED